MRNFVDKNGLFEKALEAFYKQTGIDLKLLEDGCLGKENTLGVIEGQTFNLFFKPAVTSQNLNAILYELVQKNSQVPWLLITRYVNPNLADKLREAKIQFVDTVGNAYIQQPSLHFFVKGNKETTQSFAQKSGRAFQYSGLKVIFAFLQTPELIQGSYRDIAEQANVALGSVGWVLSDLTEQGYVQKKANKRNLVNKKKLLQRWVESYHILKRKHYQATFTSDKADWWKNMDVTEFEALWGGEVAAEIVTQYLQAKDAVVFIEPSMVGQFVNAARLKKCKPEDVEVRRIDFVEPFWKTGVAPVVRGLAPLLVVYADLIHSNDARNLETAQRIYEQYLN